MSNEKPQEKAVGNLNKIRTGEQWEAELRLAGMNTYEKKDGSGSFDSWWVLVRLITPFMGTNNAGDLNDRFVENDLVFSGISGMYATKQLKEILEKHGHQYKSDRWRIEDMKQVLITYESKQAKGGGRYYHNLKAKVF